MELQPGDEALFHKTLLRETVRAKSLEQAAESALDLLRRMTGADNAALFWNEQLLAASGVDSKRALESRLTGQRDPVLNRCLQSGLPQQKTEGEESELFSDFEAVCHPLSGGALYLGGPRLLDWDRLNEVASGLNELLQAVEGRVDLEEQALRFRRESERERGRMTVLRELIRNLPDLAGSLSRNELFAGFHQKLKELLTSDLALFLDTSGEAVRMEDSESISESFCEEVKLLSQLAGEQSTLQRDLQRSPVPKLADMGKEFLTVPVRGLSGRLGTLFLVGDGGFEENHLTTMTLAGGLLGLTLGLAELHSQTIQAQSQLAQSSRLHTVGQLAAGLAHELNTPLASVVLALDGAIRVLKKRPDLAVSMLEEALQATEQGQKIVRSLLDFSRDSSKGRKTVLFSSILREVLSVLGPQLRASASQVHVETHPDKELYCNPGEIGQILSNLLLNAVDAGRQVILEASETPEGWSVRVSDNGPGIPSENTVKIFDPFFTTKPVGKGTGLGLAVSRQLARAHGGDLALLPTERGACFELRLPLP